MAKLEHIQIEQDLLGLLISDPSLITRVNLTDSDFSQQTHQIIYSAIQEVQNKGHAIDILTVAQVIEDRYRTVDLEYLTNISVNKLAVASNIEHFCTMLKESSRLRQARSVALNIQYQIEQDDGHGVVERAIQDLMAIDAEIKKYDHTIAEAVDSALDMYNKAAEKGGLIGIPTGLTELDETLGGFHDEDLIVIAARPSVGKTAMLLNCSNACKLPHGIASAEQNKEQDALRLISMNGEINSQHLRHAKLTESEFSRLASAVSDLRRRKIYINDEPGINITSLMRQARVWKQNFDIKILFVDYIQKIKGSSQRQSKIESVTEVVCSLKDLARELKIPVVALSQVNREADKHNGPPEPYHLSNAGAVEQEADSIVTMYVNEELKQSSQILLHICKNRHGPCGDITVNYFGKFFKFTDKGPRQASFD